MKSCVARAPGKLFLLGEYAILDGCPCVVAAIDRYAETRVHRDPLTATCRITTVGHGELEFRTNQPPLARGPLRFVLAAYDAVLRSWPRLAESGLTIEITSNLDDQTGLKVGLGGSAAITVATVAALLAVAADTPVDQAVIFRTALAAHHHAQDGSGSGADIGASVFGGTIRFDRRDGSLPTVTRLALPANLQLLVGWTGEAACTPDLVRRYLTLTDGCASARAAFVGATRVAVDTFAATLALGAARLSAVRQNGLALEHLAVRTGLPILTPALRDLIRIAHTHGAVAKISGAGGGDCGIALADEPAAADRIRKEWHAAGIVPLDLATGSEGVCIGHG